MIGKITKGQSFYSCISYCLEDKQSLSEQQKAKLSAEQGTQHKNRAEVLAYNNCYGDKYELAEQMRDVQKLNRKVEKPVLHISIRLAPGDQLTREQWIEVGRATAQEFGIDKNQYLSVLHHDTEQQHIHLVGNRVGYDGKLASDKHDFARMAKLCRRLEKEYHLKEVLSPRRYLSQKERQLPRMDKRKMRLKENIRAALEGARTYPQFEAKMQAKGYRVEKGRGIAFEDAKKVRVKGSEVNYSLQTIQRTLDQNEKLAHQKEIKSIQREARKKVGQGLKKLNRLFKEPKTRVSMSQEMGGDISHLIHILFRPERSGGGSSFDAGEVEERRYRERKRKGLRH